MVIRWGIIGCGSVAESKSGPSLMNAPGSALVAVASRRPRSAQEFAERHGIEHWYNSPSELIAAPEVDAVYIATPPSSHCEYALAVARIGKPCCVEKPMAMDSGEALRMINAFTSAGTPLFVSYYRRSLPRFEAIRDLMASNRIGAPVHVEWHLRRTPSLADPDKDWRLNPKESPGGRFDDLACHGLDLFDYLIGPIAEATGIQSNLQREHGVPEAVSAGWIHACGTTGNGSWLFNAPFRRDEARIIGTQGEIAFSVFDEAPVRVETGTESFCLNIDTPIPIQICHVERMCRQISGGLEHPSTGMSAARTVDIMSRILNPIQSN